MDDSGENKNATKLTGFIKQKSLQYFILQAFAYTFLKY